MTALSRSRASRVLCTLIVIAAPLLLGARPSPVLSPAQVVEAFEDALNRGDLEAATALIADDAVWECSQWPGSAGTAVKGEAYGRSLVAVAGVIAGHLAAGNETDELLWRVGLTRAGAAALSAAGATRSPAVTAEATAAHLDWAEIEAHLYFSRDFWRVTAQTASGIYAGKEEVGLWLAYLVREHARMLQEVVAVDAGVVRARTAVSWDGGRALGIAPLLGATFYTVRDGRISGFSWGG